MAKEVLVATGSEIKINAVKAAFEQAFPGEEIHARGIQGADSNIDEQPVGRRTKRGAKNRLKNARAALQKEREIAQAEGQPVPPLPDYYVSIENGIFPEGRGNGRRYVDRAVVIVQERGAHRRFATSAGVEFPTEYVEEARAALPNGEGFKTTTVGSVIARRLGGDKQDPHATLTHGQVTRTGLLIQTTVAALQKV